MDIEALRAYCLAKKEVTEEFPFGNSTLVFKLKNKIFLLASIDQVPMQFNVKCDPEKAIFLRETYNAITPGYHMNKKHWNTIVPGPDIPLRLLKEMIDDSYNLILQSLPAKERADLL